MDYFVPEVSEAEIRKEKQKARELRRSQWWKRKLSEGRCYYCGKEFRPPDLTMDHIVPVIRGGKSVKNNLATACKECNNKKKYLVPAEWGEYLKKMHEEQPG